MEEKELRAYFLLAALFSAGVLLTACASLAPHGSGPFDRQFQKDLDQTPVPMPKETAYSGQWIRAEGLVVRPALRVIDLPAHAQTMGEWLGITDPVEAQNINAWDEVPDSTWFTNRIGKENPTDDKLGDPVGKPPDMSGKWTIIRGKTDGITAGFTILDARGEMYFIKFDPPGFEGLVTGAETISSLILHWAGYNVPDNYLMRIPLDIFALSKDAKVLGEYGVKRQMTVADLDKILDRLVLDEECKIRVLASRALEGRPLGPFTMGGKRADDPNDRFPHQHRRELRGYHIVSAWLNNPDVATKNTLDMYVGEPGKGFVRHNVLDFGSSLGSAGNRIKHPKDGYALAVGHGDILHDFFTLGWTTDYWEENKGTDFTSIGTFEWENFDPLRWAPWWSNPTYETLTHRDAFWATRLIMRFSRQQIKAIVEAAQYPEEGAAEYMVTALTKRREKMAATWFRLVTPLDHFSVEQGPVLSFVDLAVLYNIGDTSQRTYRASVASTLAEFSREDFEFHTEDETGRVALLPPGPSLGPRRAHFKVHLTVHEGGETVGDGMDVYVYCSGDSACVISGLER